MRPQANHILALCSCLIFDEKSEDPITNEPELLRAFDKCQGIARSVGQVRRCRTMPVVSLVLLIVAVTEWRF